MSSFSVLVKLPEIMTDGFQVGTKVRECIFVVSNCFLVYFTDLSLVTSAVKTFQTDCIFHLMRIDFYQFFFLYFEVVAAGLLLRCVTSMKVLLGQEFIMLPYWYYFCLGVLMRWDCHKTTSGRYMHDCSFAHDVSPNC